MANAMLVPVMITEKELYRMALFSRRFEYNPTTEIGMTLRSTKIVELNKRTGLKVRSGF